MAPTAYLVFLILTDPKYRAMIADLNQEDIALYDRLRETRRGNPCALGAETAINGDYRGGVQLTPNGAAVGWLCNVAREFIAEVEVLRDGQPPLFVKADRYRQVRKEKGNSRSGVCGFRIDLRALNRSGAAAAKPEKISFRARGSDYELHGSPILFEHG